MKTTHIFLPFYLSIKLGHSEQKNDIVIDSVESPFSRGFGSRKQQYPRKISLYNTELGVVICKILVHQGRHTNDLEMTLTGIMVFPLWSHDVSTVTPNRKAKSLEKSYRI